MILKECFEKLKDGTATEEEKSFVEKEIDTILKIKSILDNPPVEPVVAEAEHETVLRARKLYDRKTYIKIFVIVLITLVLIAALVCGIIFIPSCTSASRRMKYDRDDVIEIAYEYIEENYGENRDEFSVRDVDKNLRINGSLSDAVYVYEVELRNEFRIYELAISSKSGAVEEIEVEDHT
jgi:hypothetical protein